MHQGGFHWGGKGQYIISIMYFLLFLLKLHCFYVDFLKILISWFLYFGTLLSIWETLGISTSGAIGKTAFMMEFLIVANTLLFSTKV